MASAILHTWRAWKIWPNYARCPKTWFSPLVITLNVPRPHPKQAFLQWTHTVYSTPQILSITNTTQALPSLPSTSSRMKMLLDSRLHLLRLQCTTNTAMIAAIIRTSTLLTGAAWAYIIVVRSSFLAARAVIWVVGVSFTLRSRTTLVKEIQASKFQFAFAQASHIQHYQIRSPPSPNPHFSIQLCEFWTPVRNPLDIFRSYVSSLLCSRAVWPRCM